MSSKQFCLDGFEEKTSETWKESEIIITDFVKLEVEEDISTERGHYRRNIKTNDGTRNKKKIVVKCLIFKDRSRILNTCRQKMLFKEKIFLNKNFGGDSQYS